MKNNKINYKNKLIRPKWEERFDKNIAHLLKNETYSIITDFIYDEMKKLGEEIKFEYNKSSRSIYPLNKIVRDCLKKRGIK